ncbi:class II D-tagatose-bisphosphate aldolase, non-catalytic subunit [Mesoterricola silvestris]|uniref:D-tagatose-bisphosphate aldolase, class II, non-catalytic subunit n=1 Tax=Mesoterricola silvestris TaxID=2927979 RepID=A0AA48GKS8_9BACT|nr:class II D-tagatose-bisphosphate aldolase, non-catalytic subunit [Mesoterricola silvestris]BDU71579.1 D-tagatose-bisphosphate aldolase, class II, non-catalytic subunit [Mesoterricola silvestris]
MPDLLSLRRDRREGRVRGVYAVCSAHPMVLRAALDQGAADGAPVLIEATCNQVDQFGGYTGMTPAAFAAFVGDLARDTGFDPGRIILGGDHLGPNPWRAEPAEAALAKAGDLVEAYVAAGFQKIHLDASMACAGDPADLPGETVARRAAALCLRAEAAFARRGGGPAPVYVIGTEVPPPGGAQDGEPGVRPTSAGDVAETLDITRAAFGRLGLASAWDRVIALVVQPGVEFSQAEIHAYRREAAAPLVAAIASRAPWMYEAHSTDYQTPEALRQLVEDRFAILKVGPWLTYAFREALFSLEAIALELHGLDPARLRPRLAEVLEAVMLRNPIHWKNHYHGRESELAFARRFSLSDRSRYYWTDPEVVAEVERLFELTAGPLPLGLLSQYRPLAYEAVREGLLPPSGRAVAVHAVRRVLGHYAAACRAESQGSPC